MKSILPITLAIVLGIASLAIAQPDTLANAVSFLLDLINVQSEQIDQVRMEQASQADSLSDVWEVLGNESFNPDAWNDEINDLWTATDRNTDDLGTLYWDVQDILKRLDALEVQTPSSK